jgi:putative DNA primase/helicase
MAAPRHSDPVAVVKAALGAAGKVTPQGSGWVACCPAHEDHRHSLSIGTGKDGRALLTCHAGCTLEAITGALQLTAQDLFPPSEKADKSGRITAIYEYRDAAGTVLYEVCRYFPKDFRQRVPQAGGGYSWKMEGVPRVWYRLPQLVQGLTAGKVVFVCEGEKDANALAELGLTATSLAGGASFTSSKHWASVAVEYFRGAKVVLLPDNDAPGRAHMERIAARLTPLASWVRTVVLPGLEEKSDVSDWLDAGGDVAALKALVAGVAVSTPVIAPQESGPDEPPPQESSDAKYRRTHFGNRDRFVDAVRDDVRYVAAFKAWYRWDGARFAPDDALWVEQRAQAVIRALTDEAIATDDPDQRRHLFQWAAKCESMGAVQQILDLAQSDPALARTPQDWDADPDVLNVQNGVIDLRTGVLRPHSRADNITKLVPVMYDPAATCPRWEAFLARVVPDVAVRTMLRIAVGYSLTGHTREECLFLLWGTGRNGKSTFFETIRLIAGDYAVQSDFNTFLETGSVASNGAARGDLARLHGGRLVTTSEASEGKRLNESVIKSITGGDTITARQLYAKEFEFTPLFTLWMAANHRPTIRGTDDGIWRRMRLVPFTVQIPEAEVDRTLKDALRTELPGILAWAVSGAMQWYAEGLPFPDAVRAATAAYREESDTIGEFLDDCCERLAEAKTATTDLYKAYKSWCEQRGDDPMTNTAFGKKLTDKGFDILKTMGLKVRRGLRLKSEPSELLL